MCFIKIDVVHLNICLHDTMERIVGGEDDNILTHSASTTSIKMNLFCFGCADVMCFTTVNVHHMQIWVTVVRINDLHKLRTQLLCQQNTRSNNNSRHTTIATIHGRFSIHDHRQCFTTTSGNNHLTFVVETKTFDDAFLMWTKGDHVCSVDVNSIKHRETPRRLSVPLV